MKQNFILNAGNGFPLNGSGFEIISLLDSHRYTTTNSSIRPHLDSIFKPLIHSSFLFSFGKNEVHLQKVFHPVVLSHSIVHCLNLFAGNNLNRTNVH